MAGPIKYRKLSSRIRAELEIATAVARERILEIHVKQLLELIQGARGQLSPDRAASIYARLHGLGPQMTRIVMSRVLASLGRRAGIGPVPASGNQVAAEADVGWDPPPSIFAQIRRRLRGRTNQELRTWVELHTGRTEVALLHSHVDNALRFVEILKPTASIAEVVEVYADVVGVRKTIAEVVYYLLLDRLSSPIPERIERGMIRTNTQPAAAPAVEHTLRIVKQPR